MEDRTIAGRYRLTEKIGTGGMGVVWRAEDVRLRRIVAVKELLLTRAGFDQESVDRAIREGRIAARLQHPNVIALYDVVEHDGHPWLVMEYLPSRSLATVMSERGPLPPDEVARLGGQLASGLAAAHAAGVVHRDVKPGNVLVTEFGTVKVTDFGTSRAADEVTVTASGMLVGTPAYLAPEVARGEKGEFPADVFALGATLYAAVEGSPPFGVDGNAIALLHRVADARFTPPQNAGPLAPVLMRLLDANPATRPSMADAARMLHDVRFDHKPKATALMAGLHVPPDAPPADRAPVDPAPAAAPPAAAPLATPPPAAPPQAEPPAVESQPADHRQAERRPERPGPVPPPTRTAEPSTPSKPSEEQRRDRKVVAALAVVALIAAAVVVYLFNRGDGKAPSAGDTTTTSANTTTSVAAQQPAGSQPAETTAAQQPPATTTPNQPETTTTTAEQPQPAPVGPDKALADYYGLLPNDLETGYSRLTDRFKATRSRTFADYQAYWSGMSAVSVSGVEARGPNQVAATVTYTKLNGEVLVERHLYTLVQVNGQWAIDLQEELA